MPLTHIALSAQLAESQQSSISTILQQTLEATFSVPPGDCFQFFDCYPEGSRVFDRHYLSPGRSDNFILFQITAGKPRTTEQQQALCHMLCSRLHEEVGIAPGDVMVVCQFTRPQDWSFANGKLFSLADLVVDTK